MRIETKRYRRSLRPSRAPERLRRLESGDSSPHSKLYVANIHALLQRSNCVFARRDEFLSDVSLEAGFENCGHDGFVIQLLRIVDFVPSWNAAGVIMDDIRMRLPD